MILFCLKLVVVGKLLHVVIGCKILVGFEDNVIIKYALAYASPQGAEGPHTNVGTWAPSYLATLL